MRGTTIANKLTEYRGSTFSTMLTLAPNPAGRYEKARLLTAGGVLGLVTVGSPGSYLPTRASKITTIDTSGGTDRFSVKRTKPLNRPRWFGSGALLPDGQVLVTSGGDKDEVVGPGIVDGGQRGVELPIEGTRGKSLLLVGSPPDGAVAPPGPYMLFVMKKTDKGPVPSVAKAVMVG